MEVGAERVEEKKWVFLVAAAAAVKYPGIAGQFDLIGVNVLVKNSHLSHDTLEHC